MPETRCSILALDDVKSDLDRLAEAYPGCVTHLMVLPSGQSAAEVVVEAIDLLKRHRPSVLVLDLRWYRDATYYDGIRFLRTACDNGLLVGIDLIIWSEYLSDAARTLSGVMPLLSSAGVRSVTSFPKAQIPRCESERRIR